MCVGHWLSRYVFGSDWTLSRVHSNKKTGSDKYFFPEHGQCSSKVGAQLSDNLRECPGAPPPSTLPYHRYSLVSDLWVWLAEKSGRSVRGFAPAASHFFVEAAPAGGDDLIGGDRTQH